MAVDSSIQRITRLTPLSAILALIDSRVGAVTPQKSAVAVALGSTLAEDVVASATSAGPIALRDGFAVEAGAIADAGPYSPVPFASKPQRVDVGEPLPAEPTRWLPFDAVTRAAIATRPSPRFRRVRACCPRAAIARRARRCAGPASSMRAIDIAVIAAAGIAEVMVRPPRIRIACASNAKTAADRKRVRRACPCRDRSRMHGARGAA